MKLDQFEQAMADMPPMPIPKPVLRLPLKAWLWGLGLSLPLWGLLMWVVWG